MALNYTSPVMELVLFVHLKFPSHLLPAESFDALVDDYLDFAHLNEKHNFQDESTLHLWSRISLQTWICCKLYFLFQTILINLSTAEVAKSCEEWTQPSISFLLWTNDWWNWRLFCMTSLWNWVIFVSSAWCDVPIETWFDWQNMLLIPLSLNCALRIITEVQSLVHSICQNFKLCCLARTGFNTIHYWSIQRVMTGLKINLKPSPSFLKHTIHPLGINLCSILKFQNYSSSKVWSIFEASDGRSQIFCGEQEKGLIIMTLERLH